MVIISHKPIREFALAHANYRDQLERWYTIAEQSNWTNFAEMKATFPSVDAVGNNLFVFNIKGNECRIIARVLFKARTLFIRFVGTHKEYDNTDISTL